MRGLPIFGLTKAGALEAEDEEAAAAAAAPAGAAPAAPFTGVLERGFAAPPAVVAAGVALAAAAAAGALGFGVFMPLTSICDGTGSQNPRRQPAFQENTRTVHHCIPGFQIRVLGGAVRPGSGSCRRMPAKKGKAKDPELEEDEKVDMSDDQEPVRSAAGPVDPAAGSMEADASDSDDDDDADAKEEAEEKQRAADVASLEQQVSWLFASDDRANKPTAVCNRIVQIAASPNSFELHTSLLSALRAAGEAKKLRAAREAMSALFPLTSGTQALVLCCPLTSLKWRSVLHFRVVDGVAAR